MGNTVSLVPKFLPYNQATVLAQFNDEDLAYYVIQALKTCYHYYNNEAPDFYDIYDNFIDNMLGSEMIEFYIDGLRIHRAMVNEMTLDYILSELRAEYTDFKGVIHNEAQNIINKEWI